VRDATGPARIASYTIGAIGQAPRAVALFLDFEDGRRTLRVVADPELAERGLREELGGLPVEVGAEGAARLLA
jgi:hypothetical protein